MEGKLAQYSILAQKDKGPAFISLILEIVAQQDPTLISKDIHTLVDTLINQDNIGLVVSRQVLSELVKILGGGTIKNHELRKCVVKDILATVQPRIVSYEEQVCVIAVQLLALPPRRHRSMHSNFNLPTCSSLRKNGVKRPES